MLKARSRVASLLGPFPLYPNLDLDLALSVYPALEQVEITAAQG